MSVLLRFDHGLGDIAQFTSVLRHIQVHRPWYDIHVEAAEGKHTAFEGLASGVHRIGHVDHSQFDTVFQIAFWEAHQSYPNCPSTKVERCLLETFQIDPSPDLLRYTIKHNAEYSGVVGDYFESIGAVEERGRYNVALIHYQGATSPKRKNISSRSVQVTCAALSAAGLVPVILDWESPPRSSLPDQASIFCPGRGHPIWGQSATICDVQRLLAVIDHASLFIGIDSGPLHVAAASDTPTIAVWTHHHPLHFLCPADHILNLVPEHHANLIKEPANVGLEYFVGNYRFETYNSLVRELPGKAVEFCESGGPTHKINCIGDLHLELTCN